jgi:hypothetical protein
VAYFHDGDDPSDHFTNVPNAWLRSPELTAMEKLVGAYIKSHRPDYPLTFEQMVSEFAEGRDAIRAALRGLEAKGHLRRAQRRGMTGRFGGSDRAFRFRADSAATDDGSSGDGAEQAK